MRVRCINDRGWCAYIDHTKNKVGPEWGDIDEVIEVRTEDDLCGYRLLRFPTEYFEASYFIPISDISETEMERNYNFKTEEV